MRKCISISIPCYNEEDNVKLLVEDIEKEFQNNLPEYDYEIHFIDNCSTDSTQQILRKICENNTHVKAIFNGKNFRLTSKFYGIIQTYGDCTISMVSDFQDPIAMITPMVKKWEEGYKIVIGVKEITQENHIMSLIREKYYKFIQRHSRTDQIQNFNGFGLYDKSFIDFLRKIEDPMPSFRGLIGEYGVDVFKIPYNQPKRKSGKSKNKLINLYNNAIINIVSYTKIGIRFFMGLGILLFIFSLILGIIKLISILVNLQLLSNISFMYFYITWLVSIQMIFIGVIGEYILEMNYRLLKRPLVIEKERINYNE